MEIELFGVTWREGVPFTDLEAPGDPYSEGSRTVICIRPITLNPITAGMDSGQIDGRFGLSNRYYELPVTRDGRWAEFKRASEAFEFVKNLDLERVSIDFQTIYVVRPTADEPQPTNWQTA